MAVPQSRFSDEGSAEELAELDSYDSKTYVSSNGDTFFFSEDAIVDAINGTGPREPIIPADDFYYCFVTYTWQGETLRADVENGDRVLAMQLAARLRREGWVSVQFHSIPRTGVSA